jgi:hypothetical protein
MWPLVDNAHRGGIGWVKAHQERGNTMAGKKKLGGEHRDRTTVRLTDEARALLEALTERSLRTFTMEVLVALRLLAEREGVSMSPRTTGRGKGKAG